LAGTADAERGEVEPQDAAVFARQRVPDHAVVAEIGQRVSERRQLPIEDGDDFRFGRVEHQVAEPVVAVRDGRLVARRDMVGKPCGQALDVGNIASLRRLVLAGPARHLTGEVIARLAIVGKADGAPVDLMQTHERVVHGIVDRRTLRGRRVREARLVEDAAIEPLHHVKRRADDRAVVAEQQRLRHRHVGGCERRHDTVLAVDRMGRWQQLPGRLLAQDEIAAAAEGDEIGRIGLASADGGEAHFSARLRQSRAEIGLQPTAVEGQGRRRDR